MASRVPVFALTADEYLEAEKAASTRHEYIAGQVYAMAGSSDAHNTIAGNFFAIVHARLRGGSCRVFVSDMKLRIEAQNAFYYPDVLVTCDPEDIEPYFKIRPTIVVEVTSPSTNVTDHREKALAYLKIEGLRHYILIAQDEVKVEMYRRDRNGNWWLETLGPEHTIDLETVNLEIAVKDLYEGVRF